MQKTSKQISRKRKRLTKKTIEPFFRLKKEDNSLYEEWKDWLSSHPLIIDERLHIKVSRLSKSVSRYIDNVYDFAEYWGGFYSNKVYIPTYGAPFVTSSGSDNPFASFQMGKKFAYLTKHGLFIMDSQSGSKSSGQKQYVMGFASTQLVDLLTDKMNRLSGIICFNWKQESNDPQNEISTWVTYDGGFETGQPFTRAPNNLESVLIVEGDTMFKLHDGPFVDLLKNTNKIKHFIIINTIIDKDNLLTILKSFIKDNDVTIAKFYK